MSSTFWIPYAVNRLIVVHDGGAVLQFFFDNVVKPDGGGSVINRTTPSSLKEIKKLPKSYFTKYQLQLQGIYLTV